VQLTLRRRGKMSVRFGERQKFKFAAPSHNIGLTWRAAAPSRDATGVKRVGHG